MYCGQARTLVLPLMTIFLHFAFSNGEPACEDFLMQDVCEAYVRWGKCHFYEARLSCRRTCRVCGDGWSSWSAWSACSKSCNGEQTRTRFCKSSASVCPGDDNEMQLCNVDDISCGSSDSTTTPDPLATAVTKTISEITCNGTHFRCDASSDVCIKSDLVCDGFNDCPTGTDEMLSNCIAAAGNNNTFQIKNELKQVCIEVITDDPAGPINGARAYRRCPSSLNPQWSRFQWRWWRSFHLLNLLTGRCLESHNPVETTSSKLTTRACDESRTNQKWVCDDKGTNYLLIRLKKLTKDYSKRYISLGEDNKGWPLILSANYTSSDKLWQRGPIEPPETICGKLQVYWSDWTEWSQCSATCVGGKKKHTRSCINGPDGVSPCVGGSSEVAPCNGNIACKTYGIGTPNSKCSSPWITLNNTHRMQTEEHLDPACYGLFSQSNRNYSEARKDCKKHWSFLASMKEKSSQKIIIDLMRNITTTEKIYLGIAQDFYSSPIQGHHLRYDLDNSPVGNFKPWKTDCILGPGYDYDGSISETFSGIVCQSWNSNEPHTVKYLPKDDHDHNYCRNPNMDVKGPWCYTTNDEVEKEYCGIPQCLENIQNRKLSDLTEFQLANPCIYESDTTSLLYGYISAIGTSLHRQSSCGKPSNMNWVAVNTDAKFVWDATRNRIINLKDMLCMEAGSAESDAEVTLETCDASKVTQRWKAAGGKIFLSSSQFQSDLQLDVSINHKSLVVTSPGYSAWTVSRSSGHFVDWAGIRNVPADDSFHLYSINDRKCLSVNVSEGMDRLTASKPSLSATLVLVPCRYSPSMRWMKYLSSQLLFLHLQTGLCMSPEKMQPGSKVMLLPCSTSASNSHWKCNKDLYLSLQRNNKLYLTSLGNSVFVDNLSNKTTRWTVWKTKNRTVCNIQIPRGNVAVGSRFAIRNAFNQHCLQTDETGNVFTRKCEGIRSREDEVWRFTESPTMIMHYQTRQCLSSQNVMYGSAILSSLCNLFDSRQHWTLFPRKMNTHTSQKKDYYSLHTVSNMKYMLSIDGISKIVRLRDSTTNNWVAFNKFSVVTSTQTMADCTVTNGTFKYYRGYVATSKSGKICAKWSIQNIKLFPELKENFCRNPGNSSRQPWCYVTDNNNQSIKEECLLPDCPTAKVAVDKDGKWHAVAGNEALSYFCQAEPECYRDIGVDYIGKWNSTPAGSCVPWSDHLDEGASVNNYCRNPNNSPAGPWCYINVAISHREICPIPQCHRTCLSVPEDLYHAETVQHIFAATVYGLEVSSTAVTQCHRGYWISRGVYRHTTSCRNGKWQPEPTPCKVVTCSEIRVTVSGAVLAMSSAMLYGHSTLFTCNPGLLAGPGKAGVKFHCNIHGEWEEENQPTICTLPCDDGWKPFRAYCHKINETKLNFDEALASCQALGGTLADIDDKIEFDFLKDMLTNEGNAVHGSDSLYWVGVRHHSKTPRPTDPMWRDYRSVNAINKFDIDEKKGANYLPFLRTMFYIMHFMHNRYTNEFDDILAYNIRCMFVDAKHLFVASRGCYDYDKRKMLWMWISPYHLYNVANKKCLTGFSMEGYSKDNIKTSATVETCDINNRNQFVGCRRHGHASLKLLYQENSYFVDDVTEPWDKVQMGGGFYGGNYSHWVLNTTNFDICHHTMMMTGNAFLLWEDRVANGNSYTYSEAQSKCQELGAELATEAQLIDKMNTDDISSCACAWGQGNIAYSVMKTKDALCDKSAPSGGVKKCSPTPLKADVWCYKGSSRSMIDIPWAVAIWLENITREGVQERDSANSAKFICKKESRWHCAEPPDIFRATLKESIHTSYSYLGTTSYKCDPGYWFERGVFTQVILCSSDLVWNPDPENLMCKLLDCPPPPNIVHANITVHGLDYLERATYTCNHGYWFMRNVFYWEIMCKEHAQWHPAPSTMKCIPVECDPPMRIEFAILESYSYEYLQNASYTCKEGYWFAPKEVTKYITCSADGLWKPLPYYMKCWEIVCVAPPDQTHAEWKHVDEKTTIMSCSEGYEFKPRSSSLVSYDNDTEHVTLHCGNNGMWEPDAAEFLCIEIQCSAPPPVNLTDDTIVDSLEIYDHGSEITYHCYPGNYLLYVFSPYSLSYKRCLTIGLNGMLYATSDACGTTKAIQVQWSDVGNEDGVMHIINANTGHCLSVVDVPTAASSFKSLTFDICNGTDVRHNWFCNKHGVSELILGMNASKEFYITADLHSNLVHTTTDKQSAVEFISYDDRLSGVELDLCRFRQPYFSQTINCLKLGGWSPDPQLIKCKPISCPEPLDVPHTTVVNKGLVYASTALYTCRNGYEYLHGRNTYISRCSDLGTWVPDPQQLPCKKIKCPYYKLPPGSRIVFGDIRNNFFDQKLSVACSRGSHFRRGLDTIQVKCGANKQWEVSHHVDRCHPVMCLQPPSVKHSTMTTTGNFQFNTLIRYVCENGHWIRPRVVWQDSYCTHSGSWIPDPSQINCTKVECKDPGSIPNTLRHDVPRQTDWFSYGSVVMYKCTTGRWFSHGIVKVSLTCRDDAKWYPHPTSLYCKEMTCSRPEPLPVNSFIIGDDFAFESIITVMCEPGYRIGGHDVALNNNTQIQCNKKQEWEPDPANIICLRLTCKEPPKVSFAYRIASSNLYNAYAQYVCNVGYWLQPGMLSRLSRCMQEGLWLPDPETFTCKIVDCGHPGIFHNALPINVMNGTLYGAAVTLHCREGYWVSGIYASQMDFQCSGEGLWEPPPENIHCTYVKCAQPDEVDHAIRFMLPPHVLSQVISTDPITRGTFYNYGVRMKYECDVGFEFMPEQHSVIISCTGNGTWSINISTLNCSEILCKSPPAVLHGYISENEAVSLESYAVNSSLSYQCDDGYWFEKHIFSVSITCLLNGNWDVDVQNIVCIRVACEKPVSIEHGYFVVSGLTRTHTAMFFCEDGYAITSEAISTCSASGNWTPSSQEITCETVHCSDIPHLSNASPIENTPPTIYGSVVTYRCDTDYYFAAGIDKMNITCEADGMWHNTDRRCMNINDFECGFPPHIPFSYILTSTSRSALFHCRPGYAMYVNSTATLSKIMECDSAGNWHPAVLHCEEITCDDPVIEGPHVILSTNLTSKYKFSSIVIIRCDVGHVFSLSPSKRPHQYTTNVTLTCNETAEWFPQLSSFKCERVTCSKPPPLKNATITYNTTSLKDIASYKCDGNMSFGDSLIMNVTCSEDGSWQPDPSQLKCAYHKCSLPIPSENSTISVESSDFLLRKGTYMLQYLRITCHTGYRISSMSKFHQTVEIQCNQHGKWKSNPNLVSCEVVTCDNLPNITLSLTTKELSTRRQSSYRYSDMLTYSCPLGKWFTPENISHLYISCGWDGTWKPSIDHLNCVDVTCDYPPALEHSSLRGDGLNVGDEWMYTCMHGYRFSPGVYSRTTICQIDGRWRPQPRSQFLHCQVIACEIPPILPNIINGMLAGMKPGQAYHDFREGSNFTYSCEAGYWMSDGKVKQTSKNVMCMEGQWVPSPHIAVKCIMVVCDTIYSVTGARSDGIIHSYKNNVTYTCASGQHFAMQKRRRLNATCLEDGRWWPDPNALWCSDVLCDDIELEGATKDQPGLGMGDTIVYTCPPAKWFGPNITEVASTCNEDGLWLPNTNGMKCQTVNCGKPMLKHILLPHTNFTYTNEIELECIAGYVLTPFSSTPPVLMCDITGKWYPDSAQYKCQAIECSVPRYIRHAAISGNNTYNSIITVECEAGYYIRRGASKIEAVCLHDSTWTEDLNAIFCINFECLQTTYIEHSSNVQVSVIPLPQYNSVVEYRCNYGYWIDTMVYSRKSHCAEDGIWRPFVNFTCSEIKCVYPPTKRNCAITLEGGKNQTEYPVDHDLRYHCNEYHWLSAQHDITEWAFTGRIEVQIKCMPTGQWHPHPDSFACRGILEGPLPVGYVRGLTDDQVVDEVWLHDEQFLSSEYINNAYREAVSTGEKTWLDGLSMPSSFVQGVSYASSQLKTTFAWDSDVSTSWQPNITNDRHYAITIYLGGLYLVEGIQLLTGNRTDLLDEVLHFRLQFSPDGKSFNKTITVSLEKGRLYDGNNGYTVVTESLSKGSNFSVTGFMHVAKFIQLTVTATRDIKFPPTVHEINLLASPVRWEIVYPNDYITVPVFVTIILLCFVGAAIISYKRDALDQNVVQFALDMRNNNILTCEVCYMIRITFSDVNRVKHIICRLVGDEESTGFVIVDKISTNRHLILLLPGLIGNLMRFEIGYDQKVDNDCQKFDKTPLVIDFKIGVLHVTDSLYGTISWTFVGKSISLINNEPVAVEISSQGVSKRRTTLSKIATFGTARLWIYHLLTDHMFFTIFFKDFVSQSSRMDRLLVVTTGYFFCLSISTIMYNMEATYELFIHATCFGVGAMTSLLGLPFIMSIFAVLLRYPVYNKPDGTHATEKLSDLTWNDAAKIKKEDLLEERSYLTGRVEQSSLSQLPSSEKGDGISSIAYSADLNIQDDSDGPKLNSNVMLMLQKFKHLCGEDEVQGTSCRNYQSITDTTDSFLLPANYQHSIHRVSIDDKSSISSSVLKSAYEFCKLRRHRRTRSSPAVMQFTGHPIWQSSSLTTWSSLPHILSNDNEDLLSCASLWSNTSLVRAWHHVHRSLNEPINDLFAKCNSTSRESNFTWFDPTYRRISSDILIGLQQSPHVPDCRKNEIDQEENIQSEGLTLPDIIATETQSASAQFPSIISVSTQYPTHYVLTANRHSISTQQPSNHVLSKNVRLQYPSRNVSKEINKIQANDTLSTSKHCMPDAKLIMREEKYTEDESSKKFNKHNMEVMFPNNDVDMVLRNRSNKKIVAFTSNRSAAFVGQDELTCLAPSAGAMFRTNPDSSLFSDESDTLLDDVTTARTVDGGIDVASEAIDVTSMKSIKNAPSPPRKSHATLTDISRSIKSKPLIYSATTAESLYEGSTQRTRYCLFIICLLFCCVFIVICLGISSIENTLDISLLFTSSTFFYLLVTLSLEVIFRRMLFESKERLSLSTFVHVKSDDNEDEQSSGHVITSSYHSVISCSEEIVEN